MLTFVAILGVSYVYLWKQAMLGVTPARGPAHEEVLDPISAELHHHPARLPRQLGPLPNSLCAMPFRHRLLRHQFMATAAAQFDIAPGSGWSG
ncbi:MAG: hypothetical protein R3B35_07265 [Gemmatimonadales bacterium]